MNMKTQILRFIVVGAFSAIIDLSVTLGLQYGVSAGVVVAKTVGFICGTATAFMINRVWTFHAQATAKNISAVAVLYCATYAIQVAIYSGLSRMFPHEQIYSAGIFCIAQGTATIVNFVVQRFFIFTDSPQDRSAQVNTPSAEHHTSQT